MVTLLTFMFLAADEANGPIPTQLWGVCQDTLPWLISFSLGGTDTGDV